MFSATPNSSNSGPRFFRNVSMETNISIQNDPKEEQQHQQQQQCRRDQRSSWFQSNSQQRERWIAQTNKHQPELGRRMQCKKQSKSASDSDVRQGGIFVDGIPVYSVEKRTFLRIKLDIQQCENDGPSLRDDLENTHHTELPGEASENIHSKQTSAGTAANRWHWDNVMTTTTTSMTISNHQSTTILERKRPLQFSHVKGDLQQQQRLPPPPPLLLASPKPIAPMMASFAAPLRGQWRSMATMGVDGGGSGSANHIAHLICQSPERLGGGSDELWSRCNHHEQVQRWWWGWWCDELVCMDDVQTLQWQDNFVSIQNNWHTKTIGAWLMRSSKQNLS